MHLVSLVFPLVSFVLHFSKHLLGLPWWFSGKGPTCRFRRHGFNSRVGEAHGHPVFLPGKSSRQRGLAGYSPWGGKRVGWDLVTKQQQQNIYLRGPQAFGHQGLGARWGMVPAVRKSCEYRWNFIGSWATPSCYAVKFLTGLAGRVPWLGGWGPLIYCVPVIITLKLQVCFC